MIVIYYSVVVFVVIDLLLLLLMTIDIGVLFNYYIVFPVFVDIIDV
jgi:hypothetical protein